MPKVNLDQNYIWSGTSYGPGEAEVPDSFVEAYNLAPPQPEEPKSGEPNLIEEEAPEAPPPAKTTRTKKTEAEG